MQKIIRLKTQVSYEVYSSCEILQQGNKNKDALCYSPEIS